MRRLQDKVVRRVRSSTAILDSVRAIVHLKQTLNAGGRGRGNLMTLHVSSCRFIRRRHHTHQRLILPGHGKRTRRGWLKGERGYRVCGNERGAVKCSGWVRRRKANAGRMHDESRPRYIRTAGAAASVFLAGPCCPQKEGMQGGTYNNDLQTWPTRRTRTLRAPLACGRQPDGGPAGDTACDACVSGARGRPSDH